MPSAAKLKKTCSKHLMTANGTVFDHDWNSSVPLYETDVFSNNNPFRNIEIPTEEIESESEPKTSDTVPSCVCCQAVLAKFRNYSAVLTSRDEQKMHYRSDWHIYNLRLKIRNWKPISEENFDQLVSDGELDTDSEMSSAEEKEEVDENLKTTEKGIFEGHLRQSSQFYFRTADTNVISIYKRILSGDKNLIESYQKGQRVKTVLGRGLWLVLLLSAGRFAAGLFERNSLILHKTCQKYTVRAKQGRTQSSRDGKQQQSPASAGAQLRRYNEQALVSFVRSTLAEWSESVAGAELIFFRCSTYLSQALFHSTSQQQQQQHLSKGVLNRSDRRLRQIPFITQRPSLDEVCRVQTRLAAVYSHGTLAQFCQKIEIVKAKVTKFAAQSSDNIRRKKKERGQTDSAIDSRQSAESSQDEQRNDKILIEDKSKSNKSAATVKERAKRVETKEDQTKIVSDLAQKIYTAVKTNDCAALNDIISQDCERKEAIIGYVCAVTFEPDKSSFLHKTSADGLVEMTKLLLNIGLNPCQKNAVSKVPYQVAKDRSTRQAFIHYRMENEERCEWNRTLIPLAMENICPVDDPIREAKLAEKRLKKRTAKKESQKMKKVEEAKLAEENEQKLRYLQLSDREKRALAAERRIVAVRMAEQAESECVLSRCFQCACDMTAKVPFEYCQNRFCSMNCLKNHKNRPASTQNQ